MTKHGWSNRAAHEAAQRVRQLRPTRRLVVGAEVDRPDAPHAHAVGDIGWITPRHGVALCGMPADGLLIIPDLDWEQVQHTNRCRPCQAAWPQHA